MTFTIYEMKEFVLWTLSLYTPNQPPFKHLDDFLPRKASECFTEITCENAETLWAAEAGLTENSFLHCRHITHLFKQAGSPSA